MIKTATTFVLGAGASMPYGFPSGQSLANIVCSSVSDRNNHVSCIVRGVTGCGSTDPEELAREFRNTGLYSIDAFLHRRPAFSKLGKALIAAALIPLEREDALFRAPDEHDWYRYLLNHILPPTITEFSENNLRVVTFNFDRSFERRLFLTLRATYNLDDAAAAAATNTVEIVHVHGQLGAPSWLTGAGRAYRGSTPVSELVTEEDVAACASQIHLISDELEESLPVTRARQILREESVRVCFLGFGYHPINLARLQVREAAHGGRVRMLGTAMGIPRGERTAIQRAFGTIDLTDADATWTITRFLQHYEFIHED